jgi:hypothetical protein
MQGVCEQGLPALPSGAGPGVCGGPWTAAQGTWLLVQSLSMTRNGTPAGVLLEPND